MEAAVEAASERGAPPEYDESVVDILASKILVDWLRNRRQLLVPLTVDLQKVEPSEAETLLHGMVAAAQADGAFDTADRDRLTAALRLLNAAESHHDMLPAIIENGKPLQQVLAGVPDVKSGAIVYAASLLAIDRRKRVNRYYLRYLAARLQLPRDLAENIEQRFTMAS
jgi:uncharacterized membrane protein YebE (DUF533 family)